MQFACIDAQKAEMSLARLCACAGVSISGYYAWKQRAPSHRQLDDMMILADIRNAFARRRAKRMAARARMSRCTRWVLRWVATEQHE